METPNTDPGRTPAEDAAGSAHGRTATATPPTNCPWPSGRSISSGTSSGILTASSPPPRRTTPSWSPCWRPPKQEILRLKNALDQEGQPPYSFGTVLQLNPKRQPSAGNSGQAATEESVDIFNAGRKMRVGISPLVNMNQLAVGQEVLLNEALLVVAGLGLRTGRGPGHAEGNAGRGPCPGGGPRGRGTGHPALRRPARAEAPGRRRPLDRFPHRLRPGEDPALRGGEPRPRGSAGHHLPGHRRPGPADRTDPRRRGTAVPAPGPVPRARPQGAQGHPALRPAGLRQDADRQGRGQLAGRPGRRTHRQDGHEELLPEHQGPGTAGQVRRRDRTPHPADLRPRPGEGLRGQPRGGVLRRNGFAVPHPRHRHLLRRRNHHRPAAPQRDRRRGAAGQRDRDRRLQP